MATNTNILFPQTPFIDVSTGRPSLPWVLWLQNPSFVNVNLANALPISSGGTGISAAPANGQLLIGNAGNYTLHTLSTGSGIGITNGAGLITVANTGVLSNIASSGISVSSATGNVTIANTGVLSAIAGSGISVSSSTGNVTFANTGVLSFSGGSTGLTPATATTGAISLAGTLAVAYGGTGQTTYTDGQLLIGNTTGNTLAKSTLTAGTGISISNGHGSITIANTLPSLGGTVTSVSVVTANGLAGTVANSTTTPAITLSTTITGLLKGNGTAISAATSGTDYAPATSGTSILYGNGSGGFSNVTIGSGVAFAGGTLSATGSGGTVTSVTGTAPVVSSGGATPAISMPAATTSVNGYLTSTDWTTFNNKGSGTVTSVSGTAGRITSTGGTTPVIDLVSGIATPGTTGSVSLIPVVTIDTYGRVTSITTAANPQGTVTSVAALTLGTTGTDLTSTVANGTTTPVITLNVPTASASNRGALSAADWTTFNNKGSGSVTSVSGTGTVNGITLTGTVTSSGSLTLGGTLGSIANSQLSNSTISGVSLGSNLFSLTAGTGVSFSAGTTYNGSAAITITATGSGGTVTSVSGTAPISSSGGTTPTISITQSSATTNGYLSSTDWSTFNSKGSGTVTSVTGTAPVVSSGGTTPAISMAAATTSVSGYLTSTDWTTFNGKQAALVSGTNIKTVNGTTLLGTGDVGTITYAYGGTGQTTVTTGDLLYGSATNTWSKLGIGTTGQILRVVSGAPAWGTDYVGTVTSVGGTGTVNGITLTGTVTSSGNLTLGGTLSGVSLTTQVSGILPVANGGSGTSTAFTAGSVVFAGTSGVYSQDNATFFWDSTNKRLGLGATAPAAALSFSKGDGVTNGIVIGHPNWANTYYTGIYGTVTNGASNTQGYFKIGTRVAATDAALTDAVIVGSDGGVSIGSSWVDPGSYGLSIVGNIIPGTAAKGINFTANTPASGMTSQLLNWYESGTWTPVVVPTSGAITSQTCTGTYVRVGRQVTVTFDILISNVGTGTTLNYISGLPFRSENTSQQGSSAARERVATGLPWVFQTGQNSLFIYGWNNANSQTIANFGWQGSITYLTA